MAVPHGWRAARVTPLGELHTPPRMTAVVLRLTVQVVLVASLWHGLYTRTGTTAGLGRDQAVSYAVLAVLASRLRELDQYAGRDTVLQHMHFGTIVHWYLRPLPPQRYYALRALGEQLYGLAWALGGYAVCLAAGVVEPPGSAAVAGVFVVSMLRPVGPVLRHARPRPAVLLHHPRQLRDADPDLRAEPAVRGVRAAVVPRRPGSSGWRRSPGGCGGGPRGV